MEVWKKTILNQFIWANNSTSFVIPIYQRNYVWKKENIIKLLSDIELMMDSIDDPNKFHFFWSIVYIDTIHKWSFSEWTIIDWQQRLTTVFLILQALRTAYKEDEARISKKYLINDEDIIWTNDELSRFRLKPLVTDDNVYHKIANSEPLWWDDEKSHIYRAYKIITDKVNIRKNSKNFKLDDILSAIDKLQIVWIQLDKNEDPQQVFESINSTWVSLTQSDLIRNFVLMNKEDSRQTYVYNQYWKPIEFKYVSTDKLKEFFRFYVSILEEETIDDKKVYELFKNKYLELLESWRFEDDILNDILAYAKYYKCVVFDSEELHSEAIENALEDYRQLQTNMPTLVFMHVLKMYDNRDITEEDVVKTINLLVTFVIRRNVCWYLTSWISRLFGRFLSKVLKNFSEWGLTFYESVVKEIYELRPTKASMPLDETTKEHFRNDNFYTFQFTRYILWKIENYENNVRIDNDNLSIEHIMPQKATEFWEKRVSDMNLYDEIVNRIWNLTIIDQPDNTKMKNNNFDSKKEVLKKTNHIKMNVEIINKSDWNENSINERSDEMYKTFIKIFPYPDISKFSTNDSENLLDSWIIPLDSDINVTWKSIENLYYDGKTYPILKWKNLLPILSKILYQINPDKFENMVIDNVIHKATKNTNKDWYAPIFAFKSDANKEQLTPIKIEWTEFYVEWCISADRAFEYARQMVELYWLLDDFKISC